MFRYRLGRGPSGSRACGDHHIVAPPDQRRTPQRDTRADQRALNRDGTACAGGPDKSIADYPERLHHRTRDIAQMVIDLIGMQEFLLAIC